MPAVIRVKRRIDEEPLSAFVLNSKRRRLDENEAASSTVEGLANKEELSTLLKFAGTINEQVIAISVINNYRLRIFVSFVTFRMIRLPHNLHGFPKRKPRSWYYAKHENLLTRPKRLARKCVKIYRNNVSV